MLQIGGIVGGFEGGIMARRVDENQAEIVDALRAAGCSVVSLHAVGRGVPDLIVGRGGPEGQNYLLEVKGSTGTLTPEQQEWHNTWRGQVVVVRSAEEALQVVGLAVSSPGPQGTHDHR